MLGSSSWMPYAPQGVKETGDDTMLQKNQPDAQLILSTFLQTLHFSDVSMAHHQEVDCV
jgi:hypothetical protein